MVRGSQAESEVWQSGKVISNKIESNHTYLAATNYWTPLQSNNVETDNKTKEANSTHNTSTKETPKINKWERRLARRQEK